MAAELAFFSPEAYALIVLPLLIFFARIADVSIGTVRIIFISRGLKYAAPLLGFFEVLIWLLAIGQLFQNMTNPVYYLAYAGGFAVGTFVGMWIEEILSIGTEIVRVITRVGAEDMVDALKAENYEITSVDAEGDDGKVKLIHVFIDRHDLQDVIGIVKKFDPNALYLVEEVRAASEIPPHARPKHRLGWTGLFRLLKTGR